MRTLPVALQERLSAGVTTLCRCWTLTRRDGVKLGFTDHDVDVVLNGLTHQAASGLTASDIAQRADFSVGGAEVAGALNSDALTEAELARGLYDSARVETFLVDWSDASIFLRLSVATLGEVRREGHGFIAELRGLTQALAQEAGRLYTPTCTADLGDTRCGINLTAHTIAGVVTALRDASTLVASGLDAFASGHFTGGKLTMTTGTAAGLAIELRDHRREGSAVLLSLWQPLAETPAAGDAFTLSAGCDKRFETCRTRFANAVNFRGFPHMPGPAFVLRYAAPGEAGHDGGSMNR
jgi:uncharacterized phage protein (TIGR02218 family)